MARCLVTGHKGYIGTHLCNELEKLGHEVIGLDTEDSETGSIQEVLSNSHPKRHVSHLGVPNTRSPLFYENFQPEYIFHLACWPRVEYSVNEPLKTMQNNVLATSYILEFAKKVNCKRFIYSSSSSVVGEGDGPESPYALQKYTSEIETTLYHKLYGIDTVSLRYFNVYSPDQRADGPYATAIANWMEFIRSGKKPFITGDGEQRRDMLHVSDAVAANIFAMQSDNNFCGSVYDVGTGDNISLNEIKDIVLQYFPDIDFEYRDPRPGDILETKADVTKLASVGWKTKQDITNGVKECFELLRKEINV